MQTGDCAGFGDQPNAMARRLLSRVLWVGGLAVAGSVFGVASASAAETGQADEPSGGLLGSVTSAVEPVTGLTGSLVGDTEKLVTDDLAVTEDLLGDDSVLDETELSGLAEKPIDELAGTVGLAENRQRESDARERAAERDSAITAHTDRSMRRAPADEVTEGGGSDADEPDTGSAPDPSLVSLIGTVDRLLAETDVVPDVSAVAGQLTSGTSTDVLGETGPAHDASGEPNFDTQATADPLGAVTGLMTLLDLPLAGGVHALEPLSPLLAQLDPIARAAVPAVPNVGALTGQERQGTARQAPATLSTLAYTPNTSVDAAPRISPGETGAARPAGQDGESAVIHSSPDAGTDGQNPSDDTRGGMRPSLLVTPVAGLNALHVGAPGAATSVDKAGSSSHALLPEEAVLRARLFSAAAYARSVEAKPIREANDPPVSPD